MIILTENKTSQEEYDLLNPHIANKEIEDFQKFQENAIITYKPLEQKLQEITNKTQGTYSIYFEDLKTGASLEINGKEKYTPASLLKIPTTAAILKMVEEKKLTMNKTIKITQLDIDMSSGQFLGVLTEKDIGTDKTIEELLKISLQKSDNSANHALFRNLPTEKYIEARLSMGMPLTTTILKPEGTTKMTPKQYTNIFRSLYLSSYLRKPYSQWILRTLTNTIHNKWIPSGLPKGTTISHKIGFWKEEESYHDCGIIYTQKTNYILCIMSKNTTEPESIETMKQISKEIYEYIKK